MKPEIFNFVNKKKKGNNFNKLIESIVEQFINQIILSLTELNIIRLYF